MQKYSRTHRERKEPTLQLIHSFQPGRRRREPLISRAGSKRVAPHRWPLIS